ncbi:hypothetical protein JZ751_008534 [Albula glossodonta]|uniref:Cytochrome c oxidase assembly protein COX20, mitochondrial n=1 Tax=Albula glossodonta TaxID=121402 RepID=A0A8T2N184_9TELE|nr:hypothetical protein JZ751_008534 [Albula glossodonta]
MNVIPTIRPKSMMTVVNNNNDSLDDSGLPLEGTCGLWDLESFKLLGILDIQNTPCAREALLHGTGGSLIAGLGHFLATSRVKRSCDIGVAGAKLRVQQRLIQDGIKNKVMYEGTSLDPSRTTDKGTD